MFVWIFILHLTAQSLCSAEGRMFLAGWWSWSTISGGRTQQGASQVGRQLASSALMQRPATSSNPFSSSCSSPDNIITWSCPNFIKDKLYLWIMTWSWDNEIFTVRMKCATGAFIVRMELGTEHFWMLRIDILLPEKRQASSLIHRIKINMIHDYKIGDHFLWSCEYSLKLECTTMFICFWSPTSINYMNSLNSWFRKIVWQYLLQACD